MSDIELIVNHVIEEIVIDNRHTVAAAEERSETSPMDIESDNLSNTQSYNQHMDIGIVTPSYNKGSDVEECKNEAFSELLSMSDDKNLKNNDVNIIGAENITTANERPDYEGDAYNEVMDNAISHDNLNEINMDTHAVEDIETLICFVCYKNIKDEDHKTHVEIPLECICNVMFKSMDDLMKHKVSCSSHLTLLTNLKTYSCNQCQQLIKTKSARSRHLKSLSHKQRIEEVTVPERDKTGIDKHASSELAVRSHYNTRKLSGKQKRREEYYYDDVVKKKRQRSVKEQPMQSQRQAEKLIEEIREKCVDLEKLGKEFLLLISDTEGPKVFGSQITEEYTEYKERIIKEFSAFNAEKRSTSSVPVKSTERNVKERQQNSKRKMNFPKTVKKRLKGITESPRELKQHIPVIKKAQIRLKRVDMKRKKDCKGKEERVADRKVERKQDTERQKLKDELPQESEYVENLDDDMESFHDEMGEDDYDEYQDQLEHTTDTQTNGDKESDTLAECRKTANLLLKKWSDMQYGALKGVTKLSLPYGTRVKPDLDLYACEKCGLYFMKPHHLKTHQSWVTDCDQRTFNVPQKSDDHLTGSVTLQNPADRYSKMTLTLKELLDGQTSSPFKCLVCDTMFESSAELKKHLKHHVKVSPYTCSICGWQVGSEAGFKAHLRGHFNRPFDCENCEKKFRFKSELELHCKNKCNHTRRIRELKDTESSSVEELTCSTCSYQAPNLITLAIHLSRHSQLKSVTCPTCQKTMSSGHIHRHVLLMHQDETPFECDVCQKTFKDMTGLKRHSQLHSDEKYACNICQKEFLTKDYLKVHMRIHSTENRYVCQHCGAGYQKKLYFDSHVRRHTGESPYHCTYEGCGKSFRCAPLLKQHKRTHCAVGQFVCDICGRTFKHPGQLNHHRRKHTDKNWWTCTYCMEKFKSRWMYKRHLAKEHPEKKEEIEKTTNIRLHKCDICNKVYHDTEDLTRHINIHKGIKPFQCSFCSKAFSDKSNLRAHEHTHKGTVKQKCRICYKTFLQEKNLLAHTKRIHPELNIEVTDSDPLQTYVQDINQEICVVLEGIGNQNS